MSLGYKFYRDSWIKLSILTVGLGAFLWAVAHGEVKAEPGVVPLVISLAVIGHGALLILMFRAKRKETEVARAALGLAPEPTLTKPVPQSAPGALDRELSPRGIGILLVGCGLGLGYLSVIMPLRGAAAHAESVSMVMNGCFVAPFLIVAGLLYALFPARMLQFAGPPQQPAPRAWFLYVPLLLAGALLYSYVKARLASYGYVLK